MNDCWTAPCRSAAPQFSAALFWCSLTRVRWSLLVHDSMVAISGAEYHPLRESLPPSLLQCTQRSPAGRAASQLAWVLICGASWAAFRVGAGVGPDWVRWDVVNWGALVSP